MICIEQADNFTAELAILMEKYNLGIFIDDCQELEINFVSSTKNTEDKISHYIDTILDNTARK